MKRWLMKYLCCCCRPSSAAQADADYEPPEEVSEEELQRELEAFRRRNEEEQRLRREALERAARKKQQTTAARAFAEFPALEGTRVDIDDNARAALMEVFDTEPADIIDQLVNRVAAMLPVPGNLKVSATPLKGGGVNLEIALKDAEADPAVETSYSIHAAKLSFSANFERRGDAVHMHLDRLNAQDGSCKPFFCELLQICKAARVTEMSTHATEIGAYAWVRYGFRPDTEGEYNWDSVCRVANARLDDLEDSISPDAMGRARTLLSREDPLTIEAVANLADPVAGKNGKLGFVLLDLNTWDGEFDLTDPDMLAQVERYIGLE